MMILALEMEFFWMVVLEGRKASRLRSKLSS